MRLFAITGTDTGVGKTHVTSLIINGLRARSVRVIGLKPVETGWNEATSDALVLARASDRAIDETIWRRFDEPVAPAVAAARTNQPLSRIEALDWIRRQSTGDGMCLVEGAGGWMVPFGADWVFADLAAEAQMPVVLVAASRLGVINHALLSAAAIQQRCPLLGVVISERPDDGATAVASNVAEIQARVNVPVLRMPAQIEAVLDLFHVERQGR